MVLYAQAGINACLKRMCILRYESYHLTTGLDGKLQYLQGGCV